RRRRLRASLREQFSERERFEIRERARAVGVGERPPLEAYVRQRGDFGRTQCRDLLRREQLDLFGLDLLDEPHRLPLRRFVEARKREEREVREKEKEDDGAHVRKTEQGSLPRVGESAARLGLRMRSQRSPQLSSAMRRVTHPPYFETRAKSRAVV